VHWELAAATGAALVPSMDKDDSAVTAAATIAMLRMPRNTPDF
jgi:hypothetical protein